MSDRDETPEGGAWPEEATLFRAGDRIGGRYQVLRFLGQGAMGEVYAAHDLELGSEVALKVLRAGAFADRAATERFKREILLARRVSHPNVCRIFDLGVHPPAGVAVGGTRPLLFLTMELLAGRTLVERIAADGPLSESEAAPIVRQLASALDAAHRAGVVHRDFKSSNILLVDGPGPGDPPRAVITDFGLARELAREAGAASLTATGGVLGTPAYMAPEQVEGKPADPLSDLYAFGVVLYEMLTGHFPFEGASPISMAVKRLHEPPAPPELYRPELSPRARAVLRRALEREPDERFPDALALARAFAGESPVSEVALTQLLRRRKSRWAIGLAGVVALVAVVAGGFWMLRRSAAPAAGKARPAIAVLPLRNAAGRPENAWLGTAFAEMLTTELAASDGVRTVPGETVARALRDLGIAPADALAADSLPRLHRAVGADLALVGSYVALGEPGHVRLRLDLRVQRADGGDERSRSLEGGEEELFALVDRAGEALRGALGLPGLAPGAAAGLAATQPRSERARELYARGLEALRAGEPLAAREQLEGALAEDREAPLAWAALAESWSRLGWSERARQAAKEAFDRRASLPRVEALQVEGRYRLATGDWDAAIEIDRALWRLFADDPEHGLRLVEALLEAERAREALIAIAELHALPAPAGLDPRIDLFEARAADDLSEPRHQLEAAERAAAKARESGARSLYARALYEQGVAQRKLGQPAAAREALEASRRLAAEAGDRNGAAMSAMALANLVRADGKLDEAAALFAEARTTFAAHGNRQREARAELSQGLVISQQGDQARAIAIYESALAKLREVGDRRGAASALSNVGTLLYERGDLAGALARHEEAQREFEALGDDSRVVVSLQNQAQIRQDRGDLDGAERDLTSELALARKIEDKTGEGYALKGLGDLLLERGRFDDAADRFREAITVFEGAGQTTWRLYAEMGEALVERERGAAADSAAGLARLEEAFARAGMTEDRDEAALQRLRSLVAAGQVEAATQAARELLPRTATSDVQRLRLLAGFAEAELRGAQGATAESDRLLGLLAARCNAAGLALCEFEARAERAALAARPQELAALRAEAARLGAGRILSRLPAAPH
jgi:tetratricopeptide (TPR) repeat protein/tRNA A-37 threonylcarbamoyl transferase component Bud32